MADLNPFQFIKPQDIQPIYPDMTEQIFRAGQLALQNREQQRQAIQGITDTFMALAKLRQEKTFKDMELLQSKAILEENKRHNMVEEGLGEKAQSHAIISPTGGQVGEVSGGAPLELNYPPNADATIKRQGLNLDAARDIIKEHFEKYKDLAVGPWKGLGMSMWGKVGHGELAGRVQNFKEETLSVATVLGKGAIGEDRFSDQDRDVFAAWLGGVMTRPGAYADKEKTILRILDIKRKAFSGFPMVLAIAQANTGPDKSTKEPQKSHFKEVLKELIDSGKLTVK